MFIFRFFINSFCLFIYLNNSIRAMEQEIKQQAPTPQSMNNKNDELAEEKKSSCEEFCDICCDFLFRCCSSPADRVIYDGMKGKPKITLPK